MELGQVVDFVLEYNDLHDDKSKGRLEKGRPKKETPTKRKATQADWDAFWG